MRSSKIVAHEFNNGNEATAKIILDISDINELVGGKAKVKNVYFTAVSDSAEEETLTLNAVGPNGTIALKTFAIAATATTSGSLTDDLILSKNANGATKLTLSITDLTSPKKVTVTTVINYE